MPWRNWVKNGWLHENSGEREKEKNKRKRKHEIFFFFLSFFLMAIPIVQGRSCDDLLSLWNWRGTWGRKKKQKRMEFHRRCRRQFIIDSPTVFVFFFFFDEISPNEFFFSFEICYFFLCCLIIFEYADEARKKNIRPFATYRYNVPVTN